MSRIKGKGKRRRTEAEKRAQLQRTARNKIKTLEQMIKRTKKGNVDFLKKCLEKWNKQLNN